MAAARDGSTGTTINTEWLNNRRAPAQFYNKQIEEGRDPSSPKPLTGIQCTWESDPARLHKKLNRSIGIQHPEALVC